MGLDHAHAVLAFLALPLTTACGRPLSSTDSQRLRGWPRGPCRGL